MATKISDKEIDFIKMSYPKMKVEEIAKALNRSEASVHAKVVALGLRPTRKIKRLHARATDEQVAFIKEHYREKGDWLAMMTEMTPAGVCEIRHRLQAQGEIGDDYVRHNRWTKEEVNTLIANAHLSVPEVAKLLPRHSKDSVATKRFQLITEGLIAKRERK